MIRIRHSRGSQCIWDFGRLWIIRRIRHFRITVKKTLLNSTILTSSFAACVLGTSGLFVSTAAIANPKGGKVVAGQAKITESSTSRLDVVQSTNRAAIDWRSFNIGKNEHTHFQQPSKSSVILNRVTGDNISTIAGRMTANGKVVLVNPQGILFTDSARVNVGTLIASTGNITNQDFMAGRLKFDAPEIPSSFVANYGEITAADSGLVALVAPWVQNAGAINARYGRVELASGGAFTVDLYGDGLIQLAVSERPGASSAAVDGGARVSQTGSIMAAGGVVTLSIAQAKGVLDNVINTSGIVEAQTVDQADGRIVLRGGDNGQVRVAGRLDASGQNTGDTGGTVTVLGKNVTVQSGASIGASGPAGGGTVLLGGNYRGQGPEQNAERTTVEHGATIAADATANGDGGTIVVWSDVVTGFSGAAMAHGGPDGGDGGLIEVSGASLGFDGFVDASAPEGANGTILFDPVTATILAGSGDGGDIPNDGSIFTENSLEATPSGNNVDILAESGIFLEEGFILSEFGEPDVVVLFNDSDENGVGDLLFNDGVNVTFRLASDDSVQTTAVVDLRARDVRDNTFRDDFEIVTGSTGEIAGNLLIDTTEQNVADTPIVTVNTLETGSLGTVSILSDSGGTANILGPLLTGSLEISGFDTVAVSESIQTEGDASESLSTNGSVSITSGVIENVDGGVIDISASAGGNASGGSVTIVGNIVTDGADGSVDISALDPAGSNNIAISGIDTTSARNGGIDIETATGSIAISGGISTGGNNEDIGNNKGDVFLFTDSGNISVAGNIVTNGSNGDVIVLTEDGEITLAGIDTTQSLDGDVVINEVEFGEVLVSGSGPVTIAGDINTGGDGIVFVITSEGDVSLANIDTTSALDGEVEIETTAGSIAVSGGISTGGNNDDEGVDKGDVFLGTDSGDISVAGDIVTNGNDGDVIVLTGDGQITLAGIDTTQSSDGDVGINDANIGGEGSVNGSGPVTITGDINTGGDGIVFVITSDGDVSLAGIDTSLATDGEVEIETTAGSITVSGDISTGGINDDEGIDRGDVFLGTDSGDISVAGNIVTNGNDGEVLVLTGDGQITLAGIDTTQSLGGAVSINEVDIEGEGLVNGSGPVTITGDIATGGEGIAFVITSDGDVSLAGIDTSLARDGEVEVETTAGSISISGDISTGGNNEDDVIDKGDVFLRTDSGDISVAGNIATNGTDGEVLVLTGDGQITLAGIDTSLSTDGTVSINEVDIEGEGVVNGSGPVTITGDIRTGGNGEVIVDTSDGAVSLAGIDTSSAGDGVVFIDVSADDSDDTGTGSVTVSGNIISGGDDGDVTIFTDTGDISLAAVDTSAAGNGFVDLESFNEGSITVTDGVTTGGSDGGLFAFADTGNILILSVDASAAGNGFVDLETFSSGSITVTDGVTTGGIDGDFFAFTGTGDISISSVNTSAAESGFVDLEVFAAGSIAVTGSILTGGGDGGIFVSSEAGNISLASVDTSSGGDSGVQVVTVVSGAVAVADTIVTGGDNGNVEIGAAGALAIAGVDTTAATIGDVTLSSGALGSIAGTTSANGNFTFNGPATVAGADPVSVSAANIAFSSTIDGPQGLDLSVPDSGIIDLGDSVGASVPLASLALTADTVIPDVDVTTTGDQIYTAGTTTLDGEYNTQGGNFVVSGDVLLDSGSTINTVNDTTAGDVQIAGTVDSNVFESDGGLFVFGLTVTAGTGAVTFGGNVGADTQPESAEPGIDFLNVSGGSIALRDVTTVDAQTYSGAVTFSSAYATSGSAFAVTGDTTLLSDSSVSTSGGNIAFGGAVGGGFDLVLNAGDGTIDLRNGAALGDLSFTGGSLNLGGDFLLSGNFSDLAVTTLIGDTSIAANIIALDNLSGDFNLALDGGDGAITLDQPLIVGGLSATAATVALDDVTTTGDQTYTGAVTLAGDYATGGGNFVIDGNTTVGADSVVDTTAESSSGDARFGGTVTTVFDVDEGENASPAFALTIESGTGAVRFDGAVSTREISVTSDAVALRDVTTGGAQTYTGNVTFASNYVTDGGAFAVTGTTALLSSSSVSTAGGDVIFGGAINGDGQALSIDAGDGTVAMQGGATLTDVSLSAAGLDLAGDFNLGNDFTDQPPTRLVGDTSVTSANITFGSLGGAFNLVLNAGDGNVTLNQPTTLNGLTVTAARIALDDVTTTGAQTYNGAVTFSSAYATNGGAFAVIGATTLLNDSSVASSGGAVSFDGVINGAQRLLIDAGGGVVNLAGDVGATAPLTALAVTGEAINVGNVATAGDQSFTGTTNFGGTYETNGGSFTMDGVRAFLVADTSIATQTGPVLFAVPLDGLNPATQNLLLASGSEAVEFVDVVGTTVGLGIVNAEQSNIVIILGDTIVSNFERTGATLPDDFVTAGFEPALAPLGVRQPTDPPIYAANDPAGSIESRRPARTVDFTPISRSALPLQSLLALSTISPEAGPSEESVELAEGSGSTDAETVAQSLSDLIEACPDVVLASLSWQNTPADAAFNTLPNMLPYSVDEYCSGYMIMAAGRGSLESFQGLSFVNGDFWSDLRQSRSATVIPELATAFGLPVADE